MKLRGEDPEVTEALRSWHRLNQTLMKLDEATVERCLKLERANRRRGNVMKRLRQRLGRMRATRLAREET